MVSLHALGNWGGWRSCKFISHDCKFHYLSLVVFCFFFFFSMICMFPWKGADGEDGLPGELGKAGPPVCRLLNISHVATKSSKE